MKVPLKIAALLLMPSAMLMAGFLPLWFDAPKRNNPNDPFVDRAAGKSLAGPSVATPTPVCSGGVDTSLYNFEAGTQGWGSTTAGGYTLISGLSSVSAPSCNGSKALCGSITLVHSGVPQKANFSLGVAANYSGRVLHAAAYFPANMSTGQTQMKMYIKSNGVPGGFVYSNGPSANVPMAGGWVGCVFDLNATPIYQELAKTTNTAAVQEIGLELYSPSSESDGTFNVCIDSWDPGANPTATPSPSVTPTNSPVVGTYTASPTVSPTPTNCVPTSLWSFESGAQGWTNATSFDTAITAVSPSSAQSIECAQSLALTVNLTGVGTDQGGIAYIGGATFPRDLTANSTISAEIYVPAGMPNGNGAFVYTKTGAGYTWYAGPWTNLPTTAGWTTLTFDITSLPGKGVVQEIGVKIGQGGCPGSCIANWSGTCYLDKVNIQ